MPSVPTATSGGTTRQAEQNGICAMPPTGQGSLAGELAVTVPSISMPAM
ncbi:MULTISPECIES: hypothetical protein [Rhizobium]